jgi:hypothetical protein
MRSLYESLLDSEKVLDKTSLNIFNDLYDKMDNPYNFKKEVKRIVEFLNLKQYHVGAGNRIDIRYTGPGLYMAFHEKFGLLNIGFIDGKTNIYDDDPKSMAIQFLSEPKQVRVSKQKNIAGRILVGYSIYKLPEIYHDIYIEFYKKKLK